MELPVLSICIPTYKVFWNETPIPAYRNMIHCLFRGAGESVLYCNDRDICINGTTAYEQ